MSKKSIIVLVLCTLIIIAISVSSINRESEISGIYLTDIDKIDNDTLSMIGEEKVRFFSRTENIFLIITASYLDIEDSINIIWKKISDNSTEVIQKNSIIPENKGSGEIVISLARRNNQYDGGKYKVEVYLNDKKEQEKYFSIIQE